MEIEGSAAGPVPFAMNEVLSRGKRMVVRVVLLQAGCAALVASVFLVFKGSSPALAALDAEPRGFADGHITDHRRGPASHPQTGTIPANERDPRRRKSPAALIR